MGAWYVTWPPNLHYLSDHGGDWAGYLGHLYSLFRRDFLDNRPELNGRPFRMKAHPMSEGKEATFWHIISEGDAEADRKINTARCERIEWPRAFIEALGSGVVVWWRQNPDKIMIALPDFSYVVIIADRDSYLLLWTAYPVNYPHQRRRYEREYAAFQKP